MDCGHHQTVNKLTNDTTKPSTINLIHANWEAALHQLQANNLQPLPFNN